jgi:hypothetical protein
VSWDNWSFISILPCSPVALRWRIKNAEVLMILSSRSKEAHQNYRVVFLSPKAEKIVDRLAEYTGEFGERHFFEVFSLFFCGFPFSCHDAHQLSSCRYHFNCARLLRGSHDGDNSGFYIGMVLRAWNLYRLPLSGATCQCRRLRKTPVRLCRDLVRRSSLSRGPIL